MRTSNLIYIDSVGNNNRVYNMVDLGNGVLQVEFGRMGATLMKKMYPSSAYDSLYSEKISAGYVDRTKEFSVKSEVVSNYKQIEDITVRKFVNYLLSCSREKVSSEYSIKYDCVSEEMIKEANHLIGKISSEADIEKIRSLYLRLFTVIPRKMKDVNTCLPQTIEEAVKKLDYEIELLDTLQVVKEVKQEQDRTILESNGLEIRAVTKKEEALIKKLLSKESDKLYKRAFKVVNVRTEEKFDAYKKANAIKEEDVHLFFHGSGDFNYWGIMQRGLILNSSAPKTGKMFGHGLYFANRAKKSIGYTDLNGSYWRGGRSNSAYLAIFKVAYKTPFHTDRTSHTLKKTSTAPFGYDAVYAHKGIQLYNDEIIVYKEEQVSLEYLIELEI